jgi:rod shape-determining protein MreC
VLVIFLILEGLALHYYANSTVHSRARLLGVSDQVVGGVYAGIARVEHYMSLGNTNRQLEAKVEQLENELEVWRQHFAGQRFDSIRATVSFPHEYMTARVVRNSINKRENYIMLDRGARHGVERGMAVISLDGYMVGYVEGVSASNAICVSVLGTGFRASGMFAETGQFGSISWPGDDPRMVKLSEVPKYAEVARGDSIITRGSFNFPEGIHIGTVENFTLDEARASWDIDVKLGVDIAALKVVLLVKNPEADERIKLEEEVLGETQSEES